MLLMCHESMQQRLTFCITDFNVLAKYLSWVTLLVVISYVQEFGRDGSRCAIVTCRERH